MSINNYQWKQTVVLSLKDGAEMDKILQYYNCPNISQLCKRMLRGEVVLPIPDAQDNAAQARLIQYGRAIDGIKDIIDRL